MFTSRTCVAIGAPNSACIQSNRFARAFDFVVRYTKGEEKVCVLDRKPCLTKMSVLYIGELIKITYLLIRYYDFVTLIDCTYIL